MNHKVIFKLNYFFFMILLFAHTCIANKNSKLCKKNTILFLTFIVILPSLINI